MPKKVILIIKTVRDDFLKTREELIKKAVKYSDDYIETNDSIFIIKNFAIDFRGVEFNSPYDPRGFDEYEIYDIIEEMERRLALLKGLKPYIPEKQAEVKFEPNKNTSNVQQNDGQDGSKSVIGDINQPSGNASPETK
jgi:hypothetical protein